MSFKEALKIADRKQFDLSILNDKIRPAVLKLIDYKAELYDEFIANYLEKDELKKMVKPQKKDKTVTLRARMGITDLENKVPLNQNPFILTKNRSTRH